MPELSAVDIIMEAVSQLDNHELQSMFERVSVLNTQRNHLALPSRESELLAIIKKKLTIGSLHDYRTLFRKLESGRMLPSEHTRLMDINTEIQNVNAMRTAALEELAILRNTSVDILKSNLNLKSILED